MLSCPKQTPFLLVHELRGARSRKKNSHSSRARSNSDLPVFVALNKQDLATRPEREQAVAFVRDHLLGLEGRPPVGVLRCRRATASRKLSGDAHGLVASGLPPLENALVGFLLAKKNGFPVPHVRALGRSGR